MISVYRCKGDLVSSKQASRPYSYSDWETAPEGRIWNDPNDMIKNSTYYLTFAQIVN